MINTADESDSHGRTGALGCRVAQHPVRCHRTVVRRQGWVVFPVHRDTKPSRGENRPVKITVTIGSTTSTSSSCDQAFLERQQPKLLGRNSMKRDEVHRVGNLVNGVKKSRLG